MIRYSMTQRGLIAHGAPESLDVYSPVLALTVTRQVEHGREVMVGVRSATANTTHQRVVSVPTKRIDDVELARRLVQDTSHACGRERTATAAGLRGVVEHLMARKLGMADALELSEVHYEPLCLDMWQGISLIGFERGKDVTELLTMFNVALELHAGEPEHRTASYDRIDWVRTEHFRRAARTREVRDLGLDITPYDGIDLCIRGLCIETSILMLDRLGY